MVNTISNRNEYSMSNSINGSVITSVFMIWNTQSSDVGTYTCQAENIIGYDKSSGILTVYGE